jgi:hypothetical protein
MVTQRKWFLVVLAVVVTAFVGACSGGDDSAESAGSTGGGDSSGRLLNEQGDLDAPVGDVAFEGAGGDGGTAANVTSTDTQIPGTPPRVIKTAEIRVEVPKDEFRESVQESVNIAQRSGGFVNSTTINEDSDSGSVTIRVPSESFETALGALKEIGDVSSETISGTDVTQEFVDLEARKRNLEAQETVLLNLMDDAKTVSATIRVQRELQPVQLEIERLQGRINYLEDQTAMSTITVSFGPAGAAAPQPANAFERAWENAKDTFVAVGTALVVGAGFVIPIAILLALVALAVRWLRPRFTA